jgi:hypothetical protein
LNGILGHRELTAVLWLMAVADVSEEHTASIVRTRDRLSRSSHTLIAYTRMKGALIREPIGYKSFAVGLRFSRYLNAVSRCNNGTGLLFCLLLQTRRKVHSTGSLVGRSSVTYAYNLLQQDGSDRTLRLHEGMIS